MGTREDLLAATKRCLAERGYARTTVRDIVAASGANLAAINYHFGTRDNLLNQAMLESTAAAVQRLLDALPADADTAPAQRLNSFWHKLIDSFTTDAELWTANVEAMAQALHSPQLRAETGAAQAAARTGLAADFADGDPAVGAVLQTLIGGLLVQHLIDPAHAPSAEDLTAGLRALAALS
ncbi:TetR/AcrR family transcriptional regulator [Nocardia yunnanensis]|uniref:TetR/AcrR family transcriptional regulator n=1 Tax=Nocardia yunnanensis TaxID=2382165 RepID=A0A386ZE00_9NOCA|nr:TetR/AcrR family transcriptional regulator [Nocardia yunnanensis]AYF75770.1 TetR/AcrR family transcriptional regulator [Nocardia yunnanensis]